MGNAIDKSTIWVSAACVAIACGGRSSLHGGEPVGSAGAGAAAQGGTASVSGSASKAGGSSGGSAPGAAGSLSAAGSAGAAEPGVEPEVQCPPGVVGHCSSSFYPARPGYTLALVEDFPAPLDLDRDETFTWSDGTHEGSQASFREEDIAFADGKMSITAETDCPPSNGYRHCYPERQSYAAAFSPNRQATLPEMDVWSGELRSKYNNYRFGWYEFKATAPSAPAGSDDADANVERGFVWEMKVLRDPRNVQWNQLGFSLGLDTPNVIQGLVVNKPGVTDWALVDPQWHKYEGPPDFSIHQEHVYAFAWTPNKIEWFVDGTRVLVFEGNDTTSIPSLSGKIKMNLWMLSTQTNQYPLRATFDYFRFYRYDGDVFYPCAPAPACLPIDDRSPSAQNNPNEVEYGI